MLVVAAGAVSVTVIGVTIGFLVIAGVMVGIAGIRRPRIETGASS